MGSITTDWLGIGSEDLNAAQMAVRAFIIYVVAILLVKLGEKRFMGKNTAFDMILGIILGSVLSRAVTGNAPFFPTIAAGGVLVALHWAFSVASFHSDWFGSWVKGGARVLIKDGEILWDNMRKGHISEKDLLSALHRNGQVESPEEVRIARFERSGEISVIPKSKTLEPRVVDIDVSQGVQRVRLEIKT